MSERETIDRSEGRTLFGADPASYDRVRPGHPERVYAVLVERCGLRPGSAVLEIGPGTGQATRRLLALGADPLVAVEPSAELADFLASTTDGPMRVVVAPLEEAELAAASFDLAVAASSFHWVEEDVGLAKLFDALRPGGWAALWWTLFGDDEHPDAFMHAIDRLFAELASSPTAGRAGRPRHPLDVEARRQALNRSGLDDIGHETVRWSFTWDAAGTRALYATFSPIARLETPRRERLLDEIERIARDDFGDRVEKQLLTSLYTARRQV